ncbi:MAG: TetR/AcrR family transcriptional regulator [Clostridia bacterium]|nr:TetR/AcrR family transcriptional regulator [Clostridia bacterium]
MQTTKEVMAGALKAALTHKPLNRIIVNEITCECGISRMTFYYHFTDIYDLARWTCDKEISRLACWPTSSGNWQKDFTALLELFRGHEEIVRNIYRHMDDEMFHRYLQATLYRLLRPLVNELSEGMRISENGRDRVTSFYSYTAIGTVYDWLQHKMSLPPDRVIQEAAVLTKGVVRLSLENMAAAEW